MCLLCDSFCKVLVLWSGLKQTSRGSNLRCPWRGEWHVFWSTPKLGSFPHLQSGVVRVCMTVSLSSPTSSFCALSNQSSFRKTISRNIYRPPFFDFWGCFRSPKFFQPKRCDSSNQADERASEQGAKFPMRNLRRASEQARREHNC